LFNFSRSHSTNHIFTHNHAYAELLKTNTLKTIEVETVTKLLACSTQLMGVKNSVVAHQIANTLSISVKRENLAMVNNDRPWVVHNDKKTGYHKQAVNYLGRYLKRPPKCRVMDVSHIKRIIRTSNEDVDNSF
jgi:hypothetical protein